MPSRALAHVALASSVLVAFAIAACGGDQHPGPQIPAATSTAPGSATTAPTPPGPGAKAASDAGGAAIVAPTTPAGPMKAIAGSTMAEELKKLGIDPLKPPPLNKLSPDTVRKLMPTFAKALGVKCEACHDTNNFKASTPKKKIAAKMWQEFVVGMRMGDGSPLYCDSCHGGKMEFLDRSDPTKKALSAWMNANYVDKLKRADKKEHSCEQCHGDPFEPKIVAGWAK